MHEQHSPKNSYLYPPCNYKIPPGYSDYKRTSSAYYEKEKNILSTLKNYVLNTTILYIKSITFFEMFKRDHSRDNVLKHTQDISSDVLKRAPQNSGKGRLNPTILFRTHIILFIDIANACMKNTYVYKYTYYILPASWPF